MPRKNEFNINISMIFVYIFTNRIQPFEAANISAALFFLQTNDEAIQLS